MILSRIMNKATWSWSRLKTDRLAQLYLHVNHAEIYATQRTTYSSYKYIFSPRTMKAKLNLIYSKLSSPFKAIKTNFWMNKKSIIISHNISQGRKILEREILSRLSISNTIVWSHFVGIKALCFFLRYMWNDHQWLCSISFG